MPRHSDPSSELPLSPLSRTMTGQFAAVVLWSVLSLVLLLLLAYLIGGILFPLIGAGVFGLLLLVAVVGTMWEIAERHRSITVLAYLEQAVRLNLPLPAMLRAAEKSERGRTARVLSRLRVRLEQGETLRDSLAAALPSMPGRKLGLIGSAERCGRLPQMFQRLVRPRGPWIENRFGSTLYLRWYPLILVVVTIGIVSAVNVFVIPKLAEIFTDFRLELPSSTKLLITLWHDLAIPLGLIAGGVMIAYGVIVLLSFAPRIISRDPLRGLTDTLAWNVPGMAGAARGRALADTYHLLADAIEIGRPLEWALTEASRSGTNRVLAERFAVWADHTRAGMPAIEGARRADMPSLLVGLLRSGGGSALPELLRFLARYYESRFARSRILIQALMVPAISIGMGLVVAAIVYSLFMPLIQLADSLAVTSGGFR